MGGDWKRRGGMCYFCFLLSWDVSVIGIYFLRLKERGGELLSLYRMGTHMNYIWIRKCRYMYVHI